MTADRIVVDVEQVGRLRRFEPFTGTRIVVLEGTGKDELNMYREVTYWFDEKGVLIRRVDPAPESKP